MWQSIALDDSPDEADPEWEFLDPRYDAPHTPSTTSEEAPPQQPFGGQESSDADSDEEYAAQARSQVPRRKPGGYDSRIEQILYENPDLPILITDAGKSLENGGKYIVYTIRTGVSLASPPMYPLAVDQV
jgi:sorting nexin-41/42